MKLPKPRKRGDAYRIEVMIDGRRYSCTKDTSQECTQWAANMLLSAQAGHKADLSSENMTFQELFTTYFDRVGSKTPSKRQIKEKLNNFGVIFGVISNMQISKITPKHLTDWRNLRLKQVSPATVLREISLFSSIFSYAKKELFAIKDNPWQTISKPPQPKARNRRINPDEINLILTIANWSNEPVANTRHSVAWCFLFALETAMRRGEILNMKYKDIKDGYVHLPKTKNGTARDVPLSAKAKDLIEFLPDGEFFPFTENAFKLAWQKIKKEAQIEDLHFHDTRHEAISRMVLERGLPIHVLAKITGHKKIDVLQNTYYNPSADELTKMFNCK